MISRVRSETEDSILSVVVCRFSFSFRFLSVGKTYSLPSFARVIGLAGLGMCMF